MFPNGIKHYYETELLDQALLFGMTSDQYWYDDPRLLDNYEKMYEKQRETDANNAWLNGAYVKSALASSVFVSSLYDKKIHNKMPKYPDPPKFENKEKVDLSEEEIQNERNKLFSFLIGSGNKRGGADFG